jgi:hypothetical protein
MLIVAYPSQHIVLEILTRDSIKNNLSSVLREIFSFIVNCANILLLMKSVANVTMRFLVTTFEDRNKLQFEYILLSFL